MLAQTTCPCCRQTMPVTDFQLYPKSAAVIRDGRVILLGLVQFRILQKLHAVYPDSIQLEDLMNYCYNGTKRYNIQKKNISASLHYLRQHLRVLRGVSIVSVFRSGYALRIDP